MAVVDAENLEDVACSRLVLVAMVEPCCNRDVPFLPARDRHRHRAEIGRLADDTVRGDAATSGSLHVILGHAGGMSWDELLMFVGFGLASIWLIRRTERRSREHDEEPPSETAAGTDEAE
jgi:hypothetical protein